MKRFLLALLFPLLALCAPVAPAVDLTVNLQTLTGRDRGFAVTRLFVRRAGSGPRVTELFGDARTLRPDATGRITVDIPPSADYSEPTEYVLTYGGNEFVFQMPGSASTLTAILQAQATAALGPCILSDTQPATGDAGALWCDASTDQMAFRDTDGSWIIAAGGSGGGGTGLTSRQARQLAGSTDNASIDYNNPSLTAVDNDGNIRTIRIHTVCGSVEGTQTAGKVLSYKETSNNEVVCEWIDAGGIASRDIRDFALAATAAAAVRTGIVTAMDSPANDNERLDYLDLRHRPDSQIQANKAIADALETDTALLTDQSVQVTSRNTYVAIPTASVPTDKTGRNLEITVAATGEATATTEISVATLRSRTAASVGDSAPLNGIEFRNPPDNNRYWIGRTSGGGFLFASDTVDTYTVSIGDAVIDVTGHLKECSDGQILKSTNNVFDCAADATTGGGTAPTQANVFAPVRAIAQAGTNVTITPDAAQNTLTFAATDTDTLPSQSNTYTPVKDIIQAGANITVTPNDGNNTLTIASTATGGGGAADELSVRSTLPATAGFTEGDIIDYVGDLQVLTDEDSQANIITGTFTDQGSNYRGTEQVQYDSVPGGTEPSWRFRLSRAELGGTPPQVIYVTIQTSTGQYTIAVAGRASGRDTSTYYGYNTGDDDPRAEASIGDTFTARFYMGSTTNVATAGRGAALDVHDADRWEPYHIAKSGSTPPTVEQVYNADKHIIVAGTNVTVTPSDSNNTLTIAATDNDTVFTPTQANIYPSVADILKAGTGITVTTSDGDSTITVAEKSVPSGTAFPTAPEDGDEFILLAPESVPFDPVHEMVFRPDNAGDDRILRIDLGGVGAQGTTGYPAYLIGYAPDYDGINTAQETALRNKVFIQYAGGTRAKTAQRVYIYQTHSASRSATVSATSVNAQLTHWYEVSGITFADLEAGLWHTNVEFTDGTKLNADRQDTLGHYVYNDATSWVLKPGLAAPWATQGQPEPRTLLAITKIIDGPGIGLSVSGANRRSNFQAFSPTFDLDDADKQAGTLPVEVDIRIGGSPSPAGLGFDTSTTNPLRQRTITGFTFARSLRESTAYSATAASGIQIGGDITIHNGATTLGTLKFFLAKNAANEAGYYWDYVNTSGSPTYAVSPDMEIAFEHNDGGVPGITVENDGTEIPSITTLNFGSGITAAVDGTDASQANITVSGGGGGGGSSDELSVRTTLPAVAGFSVGDIIDFNGSVYVLVTSTIGSNYVRGISATQESFYYGNAVLRWGQSLGQGDEEAWRVNVPKAPLDALAAVPTNIYGRFTAQSYGGRTQDVTFRRDSRLDTTTTYGYNVGPGDNWSTAGSDEAFEMTMWTGSVGGTALPMHGTSNSWAPYFLVNDKEILVNLAQLRSAVGSALTAGDNIRIQNGRISVTGNVNTDYIDTVSAFGPTSGGRFAPNLYNDDMINYNGDIYKVVDDLIRNNRALGTAAARTGSYVGDVATSFGNRWTIEWLPTTGTHTTSTWRILLSTDLTTLSPPTNLYGRFTGNDGQTANITFSRDTGRDVSNTSRAYESGVLATTSTSRVTTPAGTDFSMEFYSDSTYSTAYRVERGNRWEKYTQFVDKSPTQEQAYNLNKEVIQAGTNVTITPDDAARTLTIAATGGGGGAASVLVATHPQSAIALNENTETTIATAPAITAAQAGHLLLIGQFNGEKTSANRQGGGVVMKLKRGSTVIDEFRYGITVGPHTDTNRYGGMDGEILWPVNAAIGDVYSLTVEVGWGSAGSNAIGNITTDSALVLYRP